MVPPTPCPEPATFQKLMRGESPAGELESFADHLSACPQCADATEAALAGDTLANAVRSQSTQNGTPIPPAALLERLFLLYRKADSDSPPNDVTARAGSVRLADSAQTRHDFLAPPQAPDEIGRMGNYRVLRLLGAGGMGLVFQAEDLHLRRKVALKVMKPDAAKRPGARERFLREAQAAAAVEHKHIVAIHHVGEDRGVPFLAMPWLKGQSLDDRLKQAGPLPPDEVAHIGRQIALGLAAAHEKGLIHRDIKPANIWLEHDKGVHVKLLDFGLARVLSDETHLTQTGAIMGTPAYMAPEQARGEKVDHRCDLFSLGVVLYHMTTGQLSFRGASAMAMLSSLALDSPAPPHTVNPHCPPELSRLIVQLLEKDAARRPATAVAVAAALDQPVDPIATAVNDTWSGIDEPPTEAAPTALPQPARRKPRRRLPLIIAGLLLLVGGGVLMLQIIIRITDKDGKTRDIKLKPGDKVEIVQKSTGDGKGPKDKGRPTPGVEGGDPDRRAAEYVLSIGGIVHVNGEDQEINAASLLPKGPFRLTFVYLSQNPKVTDAGLAYFKECKNLQELYLFNIPVTDAGLVHFKECKNLILLNLGNTSVTDVGLAYFKECKNLTHLILSHTRVTDAGPVHFKECKNLILLNLRGTLVTDAVLVHFKECKNLRNLDLRGTLVTDVGLAYFKECKELEVVELAGTRVTDAGLAYFKECKNLRNLDLGNTSVTDAGLALFKECKNLRNLDLGNTSVTDAGLDVLIGLRDPESLGLENARISRYGFEQLKVAMPKTNIRWAEPNRRAVEQVLALGGTVEIGEPGKESRPFKKGEALPDKFFQIRRVVLTDGKQPLGELPATLSLLRFAETDRLETIDLSGTPLQDIGFLAPIHGLRDLMLAKTGLTDETLARFPKLPELSRLVLDGNPILGTGLQALAQQPKLTDLSLASTRFTDLTAKSLAGLKRLQRLSLANTALTDAGVKHLTALTSLEHLDLSGTKVTDAGVAALKKALPKCNVIAGK